MTPRDKLQNESDYFLIVEQRGLATLVIGAPHHAPEGVANLPCPTHPEADENTGYLARYLAEALDASSVIATNARVDPNKTVDTEYARTVSRWSPKLLVEVHGHGGKKANADVEISCGRQEREEWAEWVAERLRSGLAMREQLKDLAISGSWNGIHFRATGAVTLADDAGRIGLHIELPPQLRKQGRPGSPPPPMGFQFCEVLASVVRDLFLELDGGQQDLSSTSLTNGQSGA